MTPLIALHTDHFLSLAAESILVLLDFWVFLFLGLVGIGVSSFGLYFSIQASKEAHQAKIEAKGAKEAATRAGRRVRVHTVAKDLGEMANFQLRPETPYADVRSFLTKISSLLRRNMSTFAEDAVVKQAISALLEAINIAQEALTTVKPSDTSDENQSAGAVYNAVEASFTEVFGLVADLQGLLDDRSLDFGDTNG